MGEQIKCGSYKVTIKSRFGRWLVGQNRTIGWCVIDRESNEIIYDNFDRKMVERFAQNRLIKQQDTARAEPPEPVSFSVEVDDPRTGEWTRVASGKNADTCADIAARFIGGGYDARII